MKNKGHLIKSVDPGSIAEQMELEAGDILLTLNDEPIEDIFDYQYKLNNDCVTAVILKKNGEEWELDIENDYQDLGLNFENGLMSDYRSCSNRCIFCFIDQMPPGMRETLYFKDDDSRLSFLQGNYVTLTNLSDHDLQRIIQFHLAPINISVHTTNPELRCMMLHNRFAGKALEKIKVLYDAEIPMNGQIVCCPGINDGRELERTIKDLSGYLPYMESLSVVPVGLSKYRDGLYPLEPFDKESACRVIDIVEAWQERLYREHGSHFVHASDELYLLAERELPEAERYDGYIQLENGVGMLRLLMEETEEALSKAMMEIRPVCIRFDPRVSEEKRRETEEAIRALGAKVEPAHWVPDCRYLTKIPAVTKLPGFAEGLFTVQDESSALVGMAAGLLGDEKILDLCAAPGGKSVLLACLAPKGTVLSFDLTREKTARIA